MTKEERSILESLFSTKYYVNLEQEYGHMTMMGEKNASKVLPQEYEKWEKYLNKYRDLIVTGTHFTTFAVQQPAGTMILRARYGEQTKSGQHSEFNPYFGTGKKIFLYGWYILFNLFRDFYVSHFLSNLIF